MSDFVRFTKAGLIAFDWDGERREYVPDPEPSTRGQIINLRSRCEIEEGVTLGDIFRAVEADPLLMDVVGCYSWCKGIEKFHAQAKLPPPETIDTKIVEILIEGFAELHTPRKKKTLLTDKPLRFENVWLHFTGIGEDGVHYSISCTPMNELANVPVRLTNTVDFRKDFEKLFDQPTECCFSLLEVLDAIYYDISFHGDPEDNAAFLEKMSCMVKEIEDGTAKTVPLDLDALEDEIEAEEEYDAKRKELLNLSDDNPKDIS